VAPGPVEALVCSESNGYDLLLTDVVMPKMRGGELARRLREGRPDLKVLFMSGYPDSSSLLAGESGTNPPFLQKPFMIDGLARKVREVLDRG